MLFIFCRQFISSVIAFSDSFVNSQEWTMDSSVSEVKVVCTIGHLIFRSLIQTLSLELVQLKGFLRCSCVKICVIMFDMQSFDWDHYHRVSCTVYLNASFCLVYYLFVFPICLLATIMSKSAEHAFSDWMRNVEVLKWSYRLARSLSSPYLASSVNAFTGLGGPLPPLGSCWATHFLSNTTDCWRFLREINAAHHFTLERVIWPAWGRLSVLAVCWSISWLLHAADTLISMG